MFFNLTPVVKNLLILNAGMFVLQFLFTETVFTPGVGYHKVETVTHYLSLHDPRTPEFKPYQLLSHMFLHANILHIFFNMLWLVFMGPMIERLFGEKKFLFFYIVSGIGAAVLYLVGQYYTAPDTNYTMLGASGAVSGVLIATAMYFPNSEIVLFPIPIPVKMKYFVIFYLGYEVFQGCNPAMRTGNVAHFAHVGGALFGFILIKIWQKWPSNNW